MKIKVLKICVCIYIYIHIYTHLCVCVCRSAAFIHSVLCEYITVYRDIAQYITLYRDITRIPQYVAILCDRNLHTLVRKIQDALRVQ